MLCPKCSNEQHCPCEHCRSTFSKNKTTYIRVGDDMIKCAFCGFIAHMDWWETEAWKQFKSTEDFVNKILPGLIHDSQKGFNATFGYELAKMHLVKAIGQGKFVSKDRYEEVLLANRNANKLLGDQAEELGGIIKKLQTKKESKHVIR